MRKTPPTFVVRYMPGVINMGGSFDPNSFPKATTIQPEEMFVKSAGLWSRQPWEEFSKNIIDGGTFN